MSQQSNGVVENGLVEGQPYNISYRRRDFTLGEELNTVDYIDSDKTGIHITVPTLISEGMPICMEYNHTDILEATVSAYRYQDDGKLNREDRVILTISSSTGIEGRERTIMRTLHAYVPKSYFDGKDSCFLVTMVRGNREEQYMQYIKIDARLFDDSILPKSTNVH